MHGQGSRRPPFHLVAVAGRGIYIALVRDTRHPNKHKEAVVTNSPETPAGPAGDEAPDPRYGRRAGEPAAARPKVKEAAVAYMPGGASAGVRSSLLSRVERWLRGSLDRMSDDEVLRAVEAQSPAETIAEILVATPETRASADNDWAELLLRGAEAKSRIAELVGGLMSSTEAAAVLRISVPGVKQRMERHKLLAVPLPGGQWGFPALQFAPGGHVRAGVPEVAKAAARVDPWALLSILVDDAPDGSGVLLERLDDPAVLRDVLGRLATYGEHVAA